MLFSGTEWFMGDAVRGPMGACGNCTFPKDIGVNEFIPVNIPTMVQLEKVSTGKQNYNSINKL